MNNPPHVLLVEDNPADVILTREAFSEASLPSTISIARDGAEAIQMLRHEGQYADEAVPDLVLLDLNLPRKDGREVLAEIKADPELRRLPVVVLSTSRSSRDIFQCYDAHANGYLVKPVDLEDFVKMVKAVAGFWFDVAALPPG